MKMHFKSTPCALLFTALITAGTATAASSQATTAQAENYTLMGIYKLALQNDNQLKADRAAYTAGLEAITIGRSGILPQIGVDADWNKNDINKISNLSGNDLFQQDSNQEQSSWGVNLSQPLFDMKAWYIYQQGSALTDLAEAQFAADQQSTIVRVATAYFNVLRKTDDLETAQAEEKALSHQWQQTKQRFEVGLTAVTDVHEARAAYDGATAQSLEDRGLLGIAFEQLEVITGTAHDRISPLQNNFPVAYPVPTERHKWVEFALANNYSLKAAQLQSEASHNNAKSKAAGHYPTLSATASYRESGEDGLSFGSPYDTDTEGEYYGVNFKMPIFSGLRVSGERRQAQGQYLQAQELSYLAQRDTIQQARSLHLSVVTNVARVNARHQAIISSQSALDATQAGYEVGTRNLVDVLNVQRNLYQAKRNYSNALYDYIIAQIRLKEVAGNLTPADIEQINKHLNKNSLVSRSAYGA